MESYNEAKTILSITSKESNKYADVNITSSGTPGRKSTKASEKLSLSNIEHLDTKCYNIVCVSIDGFFFIYTHFIQHFPRKFLNCCGESSPFFIRFIEISVNLGSKFRLVISL